MIADEYEFMTGGATFILSMLILLLTGAFVGHFVSDKIIVSGITKKKKFTEKTEAEIREEAEILASIQGELRELNKKVAKLQDYLNEQAKN